MNSYFPSWGELLLREREIWTQHPATVDLLQSASAENEIGFQEFPLQMVESRDHNLTKVDFALPTLNFRYCPKGNFFVGAG